MKVSDWEEANEPPPKWIEKHPNQGGEDGFGLHDSIIPNGL
jgi:hypothetical protein